jgi:hypothetical protein
MNRPARALAVSTGVLLIASSFAHAFLGWPQLAPVLNASSVPTNVIGGLAAGWYFGSVAMFAFGAIALTTSLTRFPQPAHYLGIIGGSYILFGAVAYVLRDFNTHFLGFVAIGVLAAAGAFLSRKLPAAGARPDA